MAQDRLKPRTGIDRGPTEQPIELDQAEGEYLPEGGGDTEAMDVDANIGGAPATRGLDSGGAVGVRRGRAVGRPGYEYDTAPHGETPGDVEPAGAEEAEEADVDAVEDRGTDLPDWADSRLPR